MLIFAFAIILCIIGVVSFMKQAQFGQMLDKEVLENSPNFKDGQFQNLHHTPNLTEGVSYYSVLKEFFFNKNKRVKPGHAIPSVKTDLLSLDPKKNLLVWFGHSSYFIQVDGKKILADPVFSGAASPVKFTTRSFPGTDIYGVDDMPQIDYLFLSHDHWDHLDFETVVKLLPKVKKVITGIGTGAHLESWGYDKTIITEKDWNETVELASGFTVHTAPTRHFSGRTFKRNQSLWTSFVLQTPSKKIYLGGDSGYDTHFKMIGDKYGPFDLAILECGQYDKSWKYIHMLPEQVPEAAKDLRAKKLLPVHWAKFTLGNHSWDDPILRVSAAAKDLQLLTPMIGQAVDLDEDQDFDPWWTSVEK